MKLQLALDRLSIEGCFAVVDEIVEEIDWIEIGTGVIKEYGMAIIREMRAKYPNKMIVADMKTCDAGKHETLQALTAGADITTVMAFAADQTIVDSLHEAEDLNKRIMVDLLGVKDTQRVKRLAELGVDLVSLHIGKDMQKKSLFDVSAFELLVEAPQLEVTVAGGITLDSLKEVAKYKPLAVIVGSALTKAANRKETAKLMKGVMDS